MGSKLVTSVVLTLYLSLILFNLSFAKKSEKQLEPKTDNKTETEKPPTIDWGKCPQLEPKEQDRLNKSLILDSCLKTHPVPKNLTAESVELHQRQVAECALKKEKWFNKSGSYKYSKAESEIKNKKLTKTIERELLKHHKKCETEAKTDFPKKDKIIEQIQMYQACMDWHITDTCAITVKNSE